MTSPVYSKMKYTGLVICVTMNVRTRGIKLESLSTYPVLIGCKTNGGWVTCKWRVYLKQTQSHWLYNCYNNNNIKAKIKKYIIVIMVIVQGNVPASICALIPKSVLTYLKRKISNIKYKHKINSIMYKMTNG